MATTSPGLTANRPCGATGGGCGVNTKGCSQLAGEHLELAEGNRPEGTGLHLTYRLIREKAVVLDMWRMQPGS